MSGKSKLLWLTWEDHRRSKELARALGAEIKIFQYDEQKRFVRYLLLSLKSICCLMVIRPDVLIVQNPSIILAFVCCLFKDIFKYCLIVDRHTNYYLWSYYDNSLYWRVYHYLSRYTVRKADLTIVTNRYLKLINDYWGGYGFILQDKLPELEKMEYIKDDGTFKVVCVCTFAQDEPIMDILESINYLPDDINVVITGNYKKYEQSEHRKIYLPNNGKLTGFVSEEEYVRLLNTCDVVMVLTTMEHTLTCGSYEALKLDKPLILSDTKAQRDYFNKGVIYTKTDSNSIANAIIVSRDNIDQLNNDIMKLKTEITRDWNERFSKLVQYITEPN